MTGKTIQILLMGTIFALTCAVGQSGEPQANTVRVSGEVIGASGQHTIYVLLWDVQGFLVNPVQQLQIRPGGRPHFEFVVAPGRWAVGAYEDRNENAKLDMGLLGPKEPNGFWRQFKGWHKSRFDEVAETVEHDLLDANVNLRH